MFDEKDYEKKLITFGTNPADYYDFYYATTIDIFNMLLKKGNFKTIELKQTKDQLNGEYSMSILDLLSDENSKKREKILKYFSDCIISQPDYNDSSDLSIVDISIYNSWQCNAMISVLGYPIIKKENMSKDFEVAIRFDVVNSKRKSKHQNEIKRMDREEYEKKHPIYLCPFSSQYMSDWQECLKNKCVAFNGEDINTGKIRCRRLK